MSTTGFIKNLFPRLAALLAAALLAGCASTGSETIPEAISRAPAGNLQLAEALAAPQRHYGTAVRWGGTVITVRTEAKGSAEIEIQERKLDANGRPEDTSPSDGRFLIRADASVDQDLYQPGSRVTVAGIFSRLEPRRVGNSPQRLALVEVNDYMRWVEPRRYYPYYDDPYYYGWPYYRWPYYFPRFHLGIGYSN